MSFGIVRAAGRSARTFRQCAIASLRTIERVQDVAEVDPASAKSGSIVSACQANSSHEEPNFCCTSTASGLMVRARWIASWVRCSVPSALTGATAAARCSSAGAPAKSPWCTRMGRKGKPVLIEALRLARFALRLARRPQGESHAVLSRERRSRRAPIPPGGRASGGGSRGNICERRCCCAGAHQGVQSAGIVVLKRLMELSS